MQAAIPAFRGIPVEGVLCNRSSKRIWAQPNAMDTQLVRAMKLAEERDIDLIEGNNLASHFSIASFDNELVQTRAATLGVSLGSSPSEIESLIVRSKI
jgi:hypothetical protein